MTSKEIDERTKHKVTQIIQGIKQHDDESLEDEKEIQQIITETITEYLIDKPHDKHQVTQN